MDGQGGGEAQGGMPCADDARAPPSAAAHGSYAPRGGRIPLPVARGEVLKPGRHASLHGHVACAKGRRNMLAAEQRFSMLRRALLLDEPHEACAIQLHGDSDAASGAGGACQQGQTYKSNSTIH
eukprot:352824-Chlamydomonas_euryale.AAC.5